MSLEPVLHSFTYSIDYLCEQVADVADDDMAAQPEKIANHPAWVLGHITFVSQMLGEVIGLSPWLPADWAERFGPGSVPVADRSHYGSKASLIEALRDAASGLTAAAKPLTNDQLDAEFPDPAYRDVFPTVRHALTQVMIGHTAYHIGQVALWRKAMNMPRMERSYE